jgi:hypothetical protein
MCFHLFPTTSLDKYGTIDYPQFDFILSIPNFFTKLRIVLKEVLHHTFTIRLSISFGEGVIQAD